MKPGSVWEHKQVEFGEESQENRNVVMEMYKVVYRK